METWNVTERDKEIVEVVGSIIEKILLEQLDTLNDAVFVAAAVIAHLMANSNLPKEKFSEFLKATEHNIINHYHYFKGQNAQLN